MSRRRTIALSLLAVVVLLFGAATLWQGSETDPRFARVLLLDPRTGETLHEQVMDGGYAVTALLAGGRTAVATLNSCPGHDGGSISVLDPSLQRVIRSNAVDPCVVAKLDPDSLRSRLEPGPRPRTREYRPTRVTVRFDGGRIVETYKTTDTGTWLAVLAAYDTAGVLLWKRASLGRIGVADVRDGRVVVPVFGTFTPGSD